MKLLYFAANYLGHPLFIPLYAYVFFWANTPEQSENYAHWINFLVILLLLLVSPLMIYKILYKQQRVQSIHLTQVQERIWPLGINLILWSSLVAYFTLIVPEFNQFFLGISRTLLAFFIGGTLCILGALIMAIKEHKSSLHMMGVSGLLTHLVLVEYYFQQSYFSFGPLLFMTTVLIAIIGVGLVRYRIKAHSVNELFTGFCLGMFTQLIAVYTLLID
jgi:hypothetical protein